MSGKKSGDVAKKVAGRPCSFSQEVADAVCQGIMEGRGLRSICADPGMPGPATVYSWLTKYASFQEQYALAREVQADVYFDEVVSIADNEPDPQIARNRIDARKWAASKLRPKRYGDRLEVEHQGGVGMNAVQITISPATPLAPAMPAVLDVTPKPALPCVEE
ncbi:hypothetical protein [Solidesulfovibrio magneticus]|uniref:Terminase small subunit n=1 Tax=Solidesulfovibrio magneticus (strain ATCC 700980 / DSM 13731 / RS-1) TaxID=573370 RepID=C4XUL8_SOLM1|nr:hypothetical protein [Solidesulfovibrio magneticus]BAH73469.1 hypothetical protein DMR_p1_00530 [Solidesulfovibrio magneticus RS-1]